MKNSKPFVLGCIVGCGVMFVALQYHAVYSHDGLHLVPRAPKATLGLAWADVRGWKAEQWEDRPELARALVAHGASDLITDSIASGLTDSLDPDAGTIGQLRTMLNGSMSSEFDAPLFDSDDDDDLAIPFPNEARKPRQDKSFTYRLDGGTSRTDLADRTWTRMDETDSNFDSGFGWFDDESLQERPSHRLSESDNSIEDDLFRDSESTWRFDSRSNRSSGSRADERMRETTILEDLLFAEEQEQEWGSENKESDFESMTRALDFRASRALDRASRDVRNSNRYSFGNTDRMNGGYTRDRGWSEVPSPSRTNRSTPHAIRALREGFDPFLD